LDFEAARFLGRLFGAPVGEHVGPRRRKLPEKVINVGDAKSLRAELWSRIGFQESAHRTPESTHRDALFPWDLRATPPGLARLSLNPGFERVTLRFENKPLHHVAVAFGTANLFCDHILTSLESRPYYNAKSG
jgi:hypothetical protein